MKMILKNNDNTDDDNGDDDDDNNNKKPQQKLNHRLQQVVDYQPEDCFKEGTQLFVLFLVQQKL